MYRAGYDPFSMCWDMFRGMMSCGFSGGRRFYTRRERIEELQELKKSLQREIEGIDELIDDLKKRESGKG